MAGDDIGLINLFPNAEGSVSVRASTATQRSAERRDPTHLHIFQTFSSRQADELWF
jgi:hypothetical protein